MATLEERRAKKAAELAQLDAQLAKKKTREKKQEKATRDHILIQLGALVLHYADVDPLEINIANADALIAGNKELFHRNLKGERMEPKAAKEAWAELRVRHREEKQQARRAAEEAARRASEMPQTQAQRPAPAPVSDEPQRLF